MKWSALLTSICALASLVCGSSFEVSLFGLPQLDQRTEHQQTGKITEARGDVGLAILDWQKQTNVTVAEGARNFIITGFSAEESTLRSSFASQGLDENGRKLLTDSLTQQYLDDLSGLKAKKIGKAEEINSKDVQDFPPARFFSQVWTVLKGPVGFLYVTSDPEKADITIDTEEKDNKTCTKFVVSKGQHTIRVVKKEAHLDCQGMVNVGEGKTERFACPTNTDCPK